MVVWLAVMPVISLLRIPLMTVLLSVVDEMDFPAFCPNPALSHAAW